MALRANLSPELNEAQREKDTVRKRGEEKHAQTKVVKRKYVSERMTYYIENLNAQQRAVFQQHHRKAQAKFKRLCLRRKKETVKVQNVKAQAKFENTATTEKRESERAES